MAAIGVTLLVSVAAASREELTANPTALAVDDACSAGDKACALNALQTRSRLGSEPSRKGRIDPDTIKTIAAWRGAAARRSLPEYSGTWALNQTALLDQWLVPQEMRNTSELDQFSAVYDLMWSGNNNCKSWNAYFWPRLSFWGKEFMKREKTVTLGDKAAEEKLWSWTHKAMYLTCVNDFDMRAGHPWAGKVNEYLTGIVNNGGSWDFPKLDEFFYENSTLMITSPECTWWATSMICDLSYWISKLQGDKVLADGDYCWDKVEAPPYNFLTRGTTTDLDHPEYLQCQEHALGDDYFESVCNLGGHYEESVMGGNWGTGVPEEAREEVLQCQAKMGGPQTIDVIKWPYAWEPSIGLMDCDLGFFGCERKKEEQAS